ncbi:MAG TPA: TetR/AcrR family transcriptional regulator [Bacteroidia bacterium]|jgi:AcrR family transcriptional regulator|nr:TetR/AcrR family transcriptional regulator [Bacteroidia bacterium]
MQKASLNTREYILKTALHLFMENGYKGTSYQDLIKKTGLSKGAIYHHFKSKDDILTSVFEFMYKASVQATPLEPESVVKDEQSFIKLYVDIKKAQLEGFKKFLGVKKIKFNRFLFFFEAINENDALKKFGAEALRYEIDFLEKFFIGLKKHRKLPKDKDTALLAESLHLLIEGAGTMKYFTENVVNEEEWIEMYYKHLKHFFKIIK